MHWKRKKAIKGRRRKTGKYLQLFGAARHLLCLGDKDLDSLDPILWPGVRDDPWALQHCGKEMTGDMFLKVKCYCCDTVLLCSTSLPHSPIFQ